MRVLQRCTLSRCQDVPQKHPWPAQPIFYCVRGTGFREDRKQLPEAGAGVIITVLLEQRSGKASSLVDLLVHVDLHDARKYYHRALLEQRSGKASSLVSLLVHVDLHDARKYYSYLIYPGSTFCAD